MCVGGKDVGEVSCILSEEIEISRVHDSSLLSPMFFRGPKSGLNLVTMLDGFTIRPELKCPESREIFPPLLTNT